MKYLDMSLLVTFSPQTLRIKFEPPEGSTLMDLSTISSLELIQNLQNPKSKDSLLGLLNQTLTPMGARTLRSNVLQPSTDAGKVTERQEAVAEFTTKEAIFMAVRSGAEFVSLEESANKKQV
jgi:DNA mismatch repair protein MSH4